MDNKGRPLRILMLEDVPTDAQLIERELRRAKIPFAARQVETEEAFVAAIGESNPDLILADYSLPSFDALSALDIARERCPEVPFILVSGALGDELAVETLKRGATDYVLKNKLSRLVPAVQRALREAAERAERLRAEEEIKRLNRELESRVIERTEQLAAANRQLEKAVRARETLLSVASHDLRNLLSVVSGSTKFLQRFIRPANEPEAELTANAAHRIETAAAKMNELISEMLDFARMQAGEPLELYRRTTDLVGLVRQVAREHQLTTERHSITVKTSVEELTGLWDAPRLERVIGNLLANALKYSPKGGEITIEIGKQDDAWAMFRVRDRGIGIPATDLPYIFEWFRRAENVSGRISGTGIGLASARQVVEQHGGTIGVESEEGIGSTFTILLPLMRLQQSEARPLLAESHAAG